MTLATWQDVQTYLQRTLTAPPEGTEPNSTPGMIDERSLATALCDLFQGELEEQLGRLLERRTVTETRYMQPDQWDLTLSYSPVFSITSLSIDGIPTPTGSFAQEPGGLITFVDLDYGPGGFPLVSDASGLAPHVVEIVYVAGLNDPIKTSPAKRAIISRVARALNKAKDDAIGAKTINVEGYSVAYDDEGFTEAELKSVERLKRRVLVT